jgi:hypothetical protein
MGSSLALAIILQPLGFPEANTSGLITEPEQRVHVMFTRDLRIFHPLRHNVTFGLAARSSRPPLRLNACRSVCLHATCKTSPKVGSARHALRRQKQEIALKEEGAYMYFACPDCDSHYCTVLTAGARPRPTTQLIAARTAISSRDLRIGASRQRADRRQA